MTLDFIRFKTYKEFVISPAFANIAYCNFYIH